MRPIHRAIPVFILFFLISTNAFAAEKPTVFVSILPQKYFVEQIAKDLVDVQVMVQPGASPATYEPKASQMTALAKAKLYFAIGVPFEKSWLDKFTATNPKMKVVHTDEGIQKLDMIPHHHHDDHAEESHEGAHHDKDHDGEVALHDDHAEHHHKDEAAPHDDHHEHEGQDPHIWLSPQLVKLQASTILGALQEMDPAHQAVYEENYAAFSAQIDVLDQDLKAIFAGVSGVQFMVFHPAWGYFADAYGLEQVPIEIEGKDPKPAQLQKLIEHARENGIKVIFVQPQFSSKSAEVVAREIGGQVAFADPLAENWMANLRQVAEKFQQAIR